VGDTAPSRSFDESDVRVEVLGRLEHAELDQVTHLIERATEDDGVRPLSEHVSLHLRHGGDEWVRNVLLYLTDGRLAGYAHLDITDLVEGASAELVIDPDLRGHGLGRLLLRHVLAETTDGRLRLWSHGEHPGAAALAASMGFSLSRALWQLRRSLYAPIPAPELAPGVHIRTFVPGADDAAWLELNSKAFAHHPEQGGWTSADLRQRLAEPWFDTAGFFLAYRSGDRDAQRPDEDGRLVGFHWTKVHGEIDHALGHAHPGSPHDHVHHRQDGSHGHAPIGEVYVVGVDPSEQGHGLGRALTLVGLRHLRALGLPDAMLYVDADNTPAIRLYTELGFTRWDTDVMFRRG
jgi:mycothiol synthase